MICSHGAHRYNWVWENWRFELSFEDDVWSWSDERSCSSNTWCIWNAELQSLSERHELPIAGRSIDRSHLVTRQRIRLLTRCSSTTDIREIKETDRSNCKQVWNVGYCNLWQKQVNEESGEKLAKKELLIEKVEWKGLMRSCAHNVCETDRGTLKQRETVRQPEIQRDRERQNEERETRREKEMHWDKDLADREIKTERERQTETEMVGKRDRVKSERQTERDRQTEGDRQSDCGRVEYSQRSSCGWDTYSIFSSSSVIVFVPFVPLDVAPSSIFLNSVNSIPSPTTTKATAAPLIKS